MRNGGRKKERRSACAPARGYAGGFVRPALDKKVGATKQAGRNEMMIRTTKRKLSIVLKGV